jgi:hypothetical protein
MQERTIVRRVVMTASKGAEVAMIVTAVIIAKEAAVHSKAVAVAIAISRIAAVARHSARISRPLRE